MKRIKLRTAPSLMENIVRLAEYRAKRRKSEPKAAPNLVATYFCTRCDADEFKLCAAGMVHCAQCGSLMRNLLVSLSPYQEAG